MHETATARLAAYFLRPFPSTRGFSPYRSPGLLVHVPAVFLCLGLAVVLWRQTASLWILAIHLVVGLYLGRDIAILAHYNPLITLVVWASLFLFVFFLNVVLGWAQSIDQALPVAPVVVTAMLCVVFVMNAWWWCRSM